jgi:hypothetical protein
MDGSVLFIDDGGLKNENARPAAQWQRLAGRYLAPRLGGLPEAWAAANADVSEQVLRAYEAHFTADPFASWGAHWADYEEAWLGGMCQAVGVTGPVQSAERRRNPAATPGGASAAHCLGRVLLGARRLPDRDARPRLLHQPVRAGPG